ncbi:MAG TPA: GWxTD domain-containing protein, partial [Gemmatimonadales bacterium]|nr:GWxTD domain-containing protein [Gemmatimonadales bacterium]
RLLRAAERSRNDALLHLRLGLLALRRGELGVSSHYDDAASEFKWATELAPQWPYAWFGLGLAEYRLGSRLSDNREVPTSPGREAWSRATLAFMRASVLEPGLAPRLEELARQAWRDRAPERAAVVREALRRATTAPPLGRSARLLLALGRVQRETGDSGALRSFQAYLASNDDRPLALLELGRAQLLRGDLRGMTTYLAGAAAEDPPALAEYRADLLPIAGEAELADFELRHGALRAETLRRFWSLRDRLELRQEGERLAEHLRRLQLAQRDLVVVNPDGSEHLDDRGRIYVRHGEPDDRASFALPGVEPNESWRYHRAGSDLVLHFVARHSPSDFRLVESVLDVSEPGQSRGAPAPPDRGVHAGNTELLLRSRTGLASVYGQARSASPEQLARYLSKERSLGRRSIQIGLRSDSYPLRFERELGASGSLLLAGGSGQAPVLQVVFDIPGYAIEPASGAAGVVYPVRVRFVALDRDGAVVAAVDTVTRIELNDLVPANRSLVGRLAVPVRPGRLLVHAAVQYGEHAGTSFDVDTLVVPSPGGGELALGDLVLGEPRSRLKVPLGEGAVALSPGGVLHRSADAELGIEIFGLLPGARAELKVLLAPLDTVEASSVPLRWRPFPDQRATASVQRAAGAGPIVPWRATLPLKRLKAGSWLLAVEVTDATGRSARREAPLVVTLP